MNFHSLAFPHERTQQAAAKATWVDRRVLAAALPLAVGLIMILLPAPPGLPLHSWRYLALFAAVIVGLIVEPVPAAAVGFLGVTAGAVLAHFVLFSPAQLAAPGFNANAMAISWALSVSRTPRCGLFSRPSYSP